MLLAPDMLLGLPSLLLLSSSSCAYSSPSVRTAKPRWLSATGVECGQSRDRTGDLSLFRRTLCRLSYLATTSAQVNRASRTRRYFTCRLRKNANRPTPCTYNTYKAAQGDAQTTESGYSTGISRRRVELKINPIRSFPHARFHIEVPLNDLFGENIARRSRSNRVPTIQNNDVITKLRG